MNEKKNKKSGIILAAIGIVLIIGLALFDTLSRNKENEKDADNTIVNEQTTTERAATVTTEAAEKNTRSSATATDSLNEEPIDIVSERLPELKDVKYIDVFYWEKFKLDGIRVRIKDNQKTEFIIKTLDSIVMEETKESISPELLNITVEISVYDSNNTKIACFEIQDDILEIEDLNKKYQLNADKLGALTEYVKSLSLSNQ